MEWRQDGDSWRLAPVFIDAPDAQTLQANVPWYVDLYLETIGPYDLGEQQGLYPLMKKGLAIPNADLPALAAELCGFSHALPKLPNIRVTDLGVIQPTPCLDLKSVYLAGSSESRVLV